MVPHFAARVACGLQRAVIGDEDEPGVAMSWPISADIIPTCICSCGIGESAATRQSVGRICERPRGRRDCPFRADHLIFVFWPLSLCGWVAGRFVLLRITG